MGCDKKVFVSVIDKEFISKVPKSINSDIQTKFTIDKYSDIIVKAEKRYSFCQTPNAKSLGSDFDGYILIEVYHKSNLIAKGQMDFKTEPNQNDYKKVWDSIEKELNW